ncbi:MAG: hypothetical protein HRT71_02115 [Flavobacteriales bacterium]|nr:hypothetical protein [Flavobacteriales bacterium]
MIRILAFVCMFFVGVSKLTGQTTTINGFIDFGINFNPNKDQLAFILGEQDLFINSDITDKISFLGESVFKHNSSSGTKFAVALERAIVKYNYKGNHNISIGRFHTPLNYWNDSYHHGRVFFPTVGRPELFNEHIIPIHTLGFSFSAANLGKLRLGYDVMIGNGLGSNSVSDNDKHKSYTFATHIKPIDNLRLGVSAYFDKITEGSTLTDETVSQSVISGSVAYFKKHELLAEYSYATNTTDSLGSQTTNALYVYTGYRIKDIIIPYVRVDFLDFSENEMFFHGQKINAYSFGLRYEMNYLTSLKLEYQTKNTNYSPVWDQMFIFQLALGFNYD